MVNMQTNKKHSPEPNKVHLDWFNSMDWHNAHQPGFYNTALSGIRLVRGLVMRRAVSLDPEEIVNAAIDLHNVHGNQEGATKETVEKVKEEAILLVRYTVQNYPEAANTKAHEFLQRHAAGPQLRPLLAPETVRSLALTP